MDEVEKDDEVGFGGVNRNFVMRLLVGGLGWFEVRAGGKKVI